MAQVDGQTPKFFREIPPYFEKQNETLEFLEENARVFDGSDPGTGKTRPAIGAFVERRKQGGKKALVLAPKSILQSAWGNEVDKFFPGTSYMIAYATNRAKAFAMDVDIYITNHDAVSWLIKKGNLPRGFWKQFDTIIVDEVTAYKNPQAKRSKAAYKVAKLFEYREIMSGTINPNSVTEMWFPMKIIDDGEALGTSFWKFRAIVCEPKQVGPSANMIKWLDKDGAEHAVYDMIDHMTIRHDKGECPNYGEPYKVLYDMPTKARKNYQDMVDIAAAMLEDGTLLTAVHASSVHQKLMQMASGAVYTDSTGKYSSIDPGRYELIMDLIDAREQCVVAFLWRHQREELEKAAQKRGYSYGIIDGTVKDHDRTQVVEDFQTGKLRCIFAHPQSAGHGLTLTAGTTTIWSSPTYNSEHFVQFNARINRAGQEKKTETILVTARDTIDEMVYDRLDGKLDSMRLLLDLLGDT